MTQLLRSPWFIMLVFCAQPVFNFMNHNAINPNFSVARSGLYLALLFAISVVAFLAVRSLFRRTGAKWIALAIGFAVFVTLNGYLIDSFIFTNMETFFGVQPRIRHVLFVYVGLIAACGFLARVVGRSGVLLTAIVVAVGAMAVTDGVLLAWNLTEFARGQETAAIATPAAPSPANVQWNAAADPRRNVYYLLPDMMVGADMFRRFDLDSGIFQNLREQGYTVIDNARSNAPVTDFSTPHLLGMRYYLRDGETITPRRRVAIDRIRGENNAVQWRVELEYGRAIRPEHYETRRCRAEEDHR